MKRIINTCLSALLIVWVIALHGCTESIDNDNVESPKEGVLVINATLDNMKMTIPSTRAVEDIDLYDKKFTIVGFKTLEDKTFEEVKTTILPNVYGYPGNSNAQYVQPTEDTKDGKKRLITTPKGWTAEGGSAITFFAFSDGTPTSSSGYGITAHTPQTTAGYPWLDIKLQPAPYATDGTLQQGDIVAAQVMDEPNFIVFTAIDMNFKHILSKVSFKAFSSTKAKVQISDLTYGVSNIKTTGRFTFNGASTGIPGTFTNQGTSITSTGHRLYPATDSSPIIDPEKNITSASALPLGNALFIPQKVSDGYVSLVIKYSIEVSPGEWSSPVTKTLPLRLPQSGELVSGSHYVYAIDFAADDIRFSVEGIEDWDILTRALPIVFGPRGDVQVEYNADEPPFIANDGSAWVLDRSGYNRHGEILKFGTDITYNATERAYVFTSTVSSYIAVPDILDINEATIEMVMKSPVSAKRDAAENNAFRFTMPTGEHYVSFNYGNNRNIYFRSNNNTSVNIYSAVSQNLYNDYALWTFCRSKKFQMVSRNDNSMIKSKLDATEYLIGSLKSGKMGVRFGGSIKSFRLAKEGSSMAKVEARYAIVKEKYPDIGTVRPTNTIHTANTKNLVARFKKAQEPFVDADGQRYWEDLSGNGNHLWISPGVRRVTGVDGYYDFNGKDAYMKFVRKLPITRNVSVFNQISPVDGPATDRVLFHMATNTNKLSHNTPLIQYMPFMNGAKKCLWGYSYNDKLEFDDYATAVSAGGQKSYYVTMIWDRYVGVHRFLAGASISNGGNLASFNTTIVQTPINYVYVGCAADESHFYQGKIHDLIIYNEAIDYIKNGECEEARAQRFEYGAKGTEVN